MLPFSLKESRQANPLRVPQRGPYGEKYPLTGHFYLSFNISLLIFPSESPVREPPPSSPTGSLWREILRLQSHWSIYTFMSARVLKKEPSYKMGKNVWSLSTELRADRRSTYNGVQPGSPRGSLTIRLSLPQCHAALSMVPSTLAWVDQSPVSQHVS